MKDERSEEERAAECERRIREVVDSGEFVLGGGYCSPASQHQWASLLDGKARCVGCAIGSLAYSMDRGLRGDDRWAHRVIVDREGLLSHDETDQLEMGYEGLSSMCRTTNLKELAFPAPDSPFYQLGQRLRSVKNCMWEERRRVHNGG